MLKTRIWMGSLLAALTLGSLFGDNYFAACPFLFGFLSVVGHLGCRKLRGLFSEERRPSAWLCHLGLQAIIAANWYWLLWFSRPQIFPAADLWRIIVGLLAAQLILAFL